MNVFDKGWTISFLISNMTSFLSFMRLKAASKVRDLKEKLRDIFGREQGTCGASC